MNNRPQIKVPLSGVDIAIELASISIILLMVLHTIISYPDLAETVPIHFNAKGEADGFGSKNVLWILPIFSMAMYAGLFFLNKKPHLHNYMINITEENALQQYTFSTRVLRVVNFLIVLMFGYINLKIIEGAQTGDADLGMGFLITVVVSSVVLPIVLFVYQKRLNKK